MVLYAESVDRLIYAFPLDSGVLSSMMFVQLENKNVNKIIKMDP